MSLIPSNNVEKIWESKSYTRPQTNINRMDLQRWETGLSWKNSTLQLYKKSKPCGREGCYTLGGLDWREARLATPSCNWEQGICAYSSSKEEEDGRKDKTMQTIGILRITKLHPTGRQ
jgi:hypothetical protein